MPLKITTTVFGVVVVVVGIWFGYYVLVHKGVISTQESVTTSLDALISSGKSLTCSSLVSNFDGVFTTTSYISGGKAYVELRTQTSNTKSLYQYIIDKDSTYEWKAGDSTGAIVPRTASSGLVPDWSAASQFACTLGVADTSKLDVPIDIRFQSAAQ